MRTDPSAAPGAKTEERAVAAGCRSPSFNFGIGPQCDKPTQHVNSTTTIEGGQANHTPRD